MEGGRNPVELPKRRSSDRVTRNDDDGGACPEPTREITLAVDHVERVSAPLTTREGVQDPSRMLPTDGVPGTTDEPSHTGRGYLFDNAASQAGQRFDALSALFDQATFRHVLALGTARGWRCWEVGAGGPTVASWLAERVGATGHVLATDINTSWVDKTISSAVEVRHHDVTADDMPSEVFDFVHARLVLSHLPDRDRALSRMIASVKSGGWVLIEDFDQVQPLNCVDSEPADHRRANELHAAVRVLLAQRGSDLTYARKLPRLLRAAGLVQVGADAYFPVALPAAGLLSGANITRSATRSSIKISLRMRRSTPTCRHSATGHLTWARFPSSPPGDRNSDVGSAEPGTHAVGIGECLPDKWQECSSEPQSYSGCRRCSSIVASYLGSRSSGCGTLQATGSMSLAGEPDGGLTIVPHN